MSDKDLPIIGGPVNTWGQELNEFLTETQEPSGAGGGDLKSGLRINTPNLNEAVDLTATSTQLNTLTDGTTGTDATPLHQHSLAKGAVDVTTSSEEINIALDGINTTYVTAANLTQITDGSNADSLHTHTTIGSGEENKVKISSNDTTTGYISDKIIAGSNIILTENNDGGNETLTVAVTAIPEFIQATIEFYPTTEDQVVNKLYVDNLIAFSPDWQNSVISKTLTEAPSATTGDRYLVGTPTTSGDAWSGYDNSIAEYTGTTWSITPSGNGQALWIQNQNSIYYNNGSAWLTLTSSMTQATTGASGIVELATVDEINTGTDDTRIITPAGLAGSDVLDGISSPTPQWVRATQVGSDLNIASITWPALTALNSTDVAYIDAINEDLRTYRFNGSTWSQVGSGLNIADTNYPALAALNGTDVAFIDDVSKDLRTYRFNGSTWSQVGSDLFISGVAAPSLASLNGTDVAFIDTGNDDLRTYRFNGSTWSQVGSDLNISSNFPTLAALNGTDVAFIDDSNDDLRTYRWNNTSETWSQVGSGLNIPGVGGSALAALNGTDVAFIDTGNDDLRTYRWSGSVWSKVGSGLNIAGIGATSLAALNGTDIAFIDDANDDLRTYRFAFSVGNGPYRPA